MCMKYIMSLATLKKKSAAKYNNMSVGTPQFSLYGGHRNQGWVGQSSRLSRPETCLNDNQVIKTANAKQPPCPDAAACNVVKQDDAHKETDQGNYIEEKAKAAIICTEHSQQYNNGSAPSTSCRKLDCTKFKQQANVYKDMTTRSSSDYVRSLSKRCMVNVDGLNLPYIAPPAPESNTQMDPNYNPNLIIRGAVVDGYVRDAQVEIKDPITNTTVKSTTTDAFGKYMIAVSYLDIPEIFELVVAPGGIDIATGATVTTILKTVSTRAEALSLALSNKQLHVTPLSSLIASMSKNMTVAAAKERVASVFHVSVEDVEKDHIAEENVALTKAVQQLDVVTSTLAATKASIDADDVMASISAALRNNANFSITSSIAEVVSQLEQKANITLSERTKINAIAIAQSMTTAIEEIASTDSFTEVITQATQLAEATKAEVEKETFDFNDESLDTDTVSETIDAASGSIDVGNVMGSDTYVPEPEPFKMDFAPIKGMSIGDSRDYFDMAYADVQPQFVFDRKDSSQYPVGLDGINVWSNAGEGYFQFTSTASGTCIVVYGSGASTTNLYKNDELVETTTEMKTTASFDIAVGDVVKIHESDGVIFIYSITLDGDIAPTDTPSPYHLWNGGNAVAKDQIEYIEIPKDNVHIAMANGDGTDWNDGRSAFRVIPWTSRDEGNKRNFMLWNHGYAGTASNPTSSVTRNTAMSSLPITRGLYIQLKVEDEQVTITELRTGIIDTNHVLEYFIASFLENVGTGDFGFTTSADYDLVHFILENKVPDTNTPEEAVSFPGPAYGINSTPYNVLVSENREYGYFQTYRDRLNRKNRIERSYTTQIQNFKNSSSDYYSKFILRGYFKPKVSGIHKFIFSGNGLGGFMMNVWATGYGAYGRNMSVTGRNLHFTIYLKNTEVYPIRIVVIGPNRPISLSFQEPDPTTGFSDAMIDFTEYLHWTPYDQVFCNVQSLPQNNTVIQVGVEAEYEGGQNKYTFGGNEYNSNTQIGVTYGTYRLNIPASHPMGFEFSNSEHVNVTGTNVHSTDANGVTYYTGIVTLKVKTDFGTASYKCALHGYMGGQKNLHFESLFAPEPENEETKLDDGSYQITWNTTSWFDTVIDIVVNQNDLTITEKGWTYTWNEENSRYEDVDDNGIVAFHLTITGDSVIDEYGATGTIQPQ